MMTLISACFIWRTLFILLVVAVPSGLASASKDCTCGFYDALTGGVFTESTIVYFNETTEIPNDALVVKSYEHRFDRGWNTLYRMGASKVNVQIGNDTTSRNLQSLQLYCDPATSEHLVVGADVRTARQDIFFGSFRAMMRSPRKWMPGSAITMLLDHNQTERWDVDVMNTKNQSTAWVSMLAKGEFPNRWLGVNFTTLENAGIDPWNYTEYRVDWTADSINYYIGGQLQSSMTKAINGTIPSTPAPLQFQHWSTGNFYSMQGPPFGRSEANVAWIRLFFNSSTTTSDQQQQFDSRCRPTDACLMDDMSLRGSSAYPPASLEKWKQEHPKQPTRWIPIVIDVAFGFLSTFLIAKTINRRTSWRKLFTKISNVHKPHKSGMKTPDPSFGLATGMPGVLSRPDEELISSGPSSEIHTPTYGRHFGTDTPPLYSGRHTPAPQYQTSYQTPNSSAMNLSSLRRSPGMNDDLLIERIAEESNQDKNQPTHSTPLDNPFLSSEEKATMERSRQKPAPAVSVALVQEKHLPPPSPSIAAEPMADQKKPLPDVKTAALPATGDGKPAPAKRVDYLAGFIAMSAILVTWNHFGLTYFAQVIIPSVPAHYKSEVWARKTFASYVFDPLWIGPFLMISTRFLISNYLRTGKLDNVAQKITMRPFRLLIPVAVIAMLEYFLMDTGAITWLEYLPSITWSAWPFTAIPTNAGTFVSQVLQLAYLIPNAAPQITYYYCTGVLWTIPVQLQGAWQTLLAVIMIREIKTPYKRFGFYAFCMINHWYALSWGSYYYAGVLLADLDLTYKYTKWLWPRPFIYYPILALIIVAALSGFTLDLITQWTGVNYATWENSWHPDVSTGLTIGQAGKATYPDYFIPRLNGLISTVFMQALVEISPTMQKIFSAKFLQLIFPHIFTIYLIHGFIFWSVGSWAMVGMFGHGFPYWLCQILVAIICYATLFASLPLLTPVIEVVGKNVTQSIWEHASQEPPPRNPTLYPFSKSIFDDALEETIEAEKGRKTTNEKDMEMTKQAVAVTTLVPDHGVFKDVGLA